MYIQCKKKLRSIKKLFQTNASDILKKCSYVAKQIFPTLQRLFIQCKKCPCSFRKIIITTKNIFERVFENNVDNVLKKTMAPLPPHPLPSTGDHGDDQ